MSDVNVSVTDSSVNVMVGELRYYGSFYSTADQTNAGATSENIMTCSATDLSYGVSLVSSSRFTIANAGIYSITVFAQFDKTDGGDDAVQIWLKKNGSNVANTTVEMTLHSQDGKGHVCMDWMVSAGAGDYYQIAWHSSDTAMFINSVAAATSPTRPAIPSVLVNINKVG